MAVCNGLALINKTVVGMDLERNMFKAVEARFLVSPIPELLGFLVSPILELLGFLVSPIPEFFRVSGESHA